MAVDTAIRRSSSIGIDLPFLKVYATPDGTIAAADRVHTAGKYRAFFEPSPGSSDQSRYRMLKGLG